MNGLPERWLVFAREDLAVAKIVLDDYEKGTFFHSKLVLTLLLLPFTYFILLHHVKYSSLFAPTDEPAPRPLNAEDRCRDHVKDRERCSTS